MADTWRVAVQTLEGLGKPSYRVGDVTKKLSSVFKRDEPEPELKHVVIEVQVGDTINRTPEFDVPDSDWAHVGQVFFVPRPPTSQSVMFRVIRLHRIQKDALIGEAQVTAAAGQMRLKLMRNGKQQGTLVVTVTEGIPQRPSSASTASVASAPKDSRNVTFSHASTTANGSDILMDPGGSILDAPVVPRMDIPRIEIRPPPALKSPRQSEPKSPRQSESKSPRLTGLMSDSVRQARIDGDRPASNSSTLKEAALSTASASVPGLAERLSSGASPSAAGQAKQPEPAPSCLQPCLDGLLKLLGMVIGEEVVAGHRMLALKRKEEGVVATPSGLLYKVLRKGTGHVSPSATSLCDVFYRGYLVNGREFDASPPGKTATFTPSQLIKGWAEALQLMVEGDRWELYVPADLAYGSQGAGGVVPANAALIFQVELVRVRSK